MPLAAPLRDPPRPSGPKGLRREAEVCAAAEHPGPCPEPRLGTASASKLNFFCKLSGSCSARMNSASSIFPFSLLSMASVSCCSTSSDTSTPKRRKPR
eukprot:Skav201474  [mRNA]  locus=scaffold828:25596:31937:+ [translate_table: standard]